MTTPQTPPSDDDQHGAVASDARAREAALREILEVISASRGDEGPVFEVILRNAAKLCDAQLAALTLANDARTHLSYVAHWGTPLEIFQPGVTVWPLDSPIIMCRAVRSTQVVHVGDMADDDLYRDGDPKRVSIVDVQGVRTMLAVPLIVDGKAIGCIGLHRNKVRPFEDNEIARVETFAEQAVIAIENVRQFRELRTRLERERATSDVLRVISQSRTDAQPVFQATHDNVSLLCDAPFSGVFLLDEAAEKLEIVSHRGGNPDYVADAKRAWPLSDKAAQCRAVLRNEVVHVHDLTETEAYQSGHETTVRAVKVEGIRTFLAVPLMKGSQAIGSIGTYRCEARPFPDGEVELLQTFHETLGRLIHDAGAGFGHRAGDGIMVVFNDPVPCDDPAAAALRVAVQMRQCMVEICTKWRKLGHRMGFGVGISLGYATVGMVGFEGRFDYTASGTAVNLAARLCDQAEDQEILLSQRAATALEDVAEIASAGELTLKGFHAPVDVFKVTGLKEIA